jgi:hypothetical protein
MKPDFPHSVLELGIQHSNEYLKLLETYLLLTPHLLPKDAAHPLNQPTLRHPNLTPNNIFILPETGRISCLVNWQHAIIQPLALVAGYPHSFENLDAILPDLDSMPKFIDNDLLSLDADEQIAMRDVHRYRLLFSCTTSSPALQMRHT